MFALLETSRSSRLISAVTLLMMALIFIPTVVIFSRPTGYIPFIAGAAFSTACLAVLWFSHRKPLPAKMAC